MKGATIRLHFNGDSEDYEDFERLLEECEYDVAIEEMREFP
jgi:hypothetical protein